MFGFDLFDIDQHSLLHFCLIFFRLVYFYSMTPIDWSACPLLVCGWPQNNICRCIQTHVRVLLAMWILSFRRLSLNCYANVMCCNFIKLVCHIQSNDSNNFVICATLHAGATLMVHDGLNYFRMNVFKVYQYTTGISFVATCRKLSFPSPFFNFRSRLTICISVSQSSFVALSFLRMHRIRLWSVVVWLFVDGGRKDVHTRDILADVIKPLATRLDQLARRRPPTIGRSQSQ